FLGRDPTTLDIWLRIDVIAALAVMGPAARPAVPALISELTTISTLQNSKRDYVNAQSHWLRTVIMALALIDGRAPEVLAALRTQLGSDDAGAGRAALAALVQLSPDSPG